MSPLDRSKQNFDRTKSGGGGTGEVGRKGRVSTGVVGKGRARRVGSPSSTVSLQINSSL